MMIERLTVLNQIEVTENSTLQLRFAFKLVEEGVEISSAWHRTALATGVDVNAAMQDLSAAFIAMNNKPVSEADIDKIQAVANAVWK
jgi:hypothetical protein